MATIQIDNKPEILFEFAEVKAPTVLIKELLPFRIRITDKDIIGFTIANTPPIPLQIIGLSNYIL